MMKKIFKKLGKLLKWLVILFFAMGFIIDVFDSNIYYYAHSKYTDKRRLPGVVVDNLTEIVSDYNRDDFENYSFDFDGINTIFHDINNRGLKIELHSKNSEDEYSVRVNFNKVQDKGYTQAYYYFDKNFLFIGGFQEGGNKNYISPTKEEVKEIEKYLSEMSDKLLENYDPLINYQWFYDVLFTDRTVDKYD